MDEAMGAAENQADRRDERDRWTPGLKPGRIEALTDGVFAIAMTIIVLELSVPFLLGSSGPGEHPTSFLEMWDEFYIYVLGFLTLGIYWVLHRYMFYFIRRSDGVLIWLNILFLMLASMVPFSTKVLMLNERLIASAPDEGTAAYEFFVFTTVGTILLLLVIWQYATRGHRLVDRDIDERITSTLTRVILIGVAVMLVGVVLSYFIPWAGYLGMGAMAFMIVVTAYGRFRPVEGRTEVPKQA